MADHTCAACGTELVKAPRGRWPKWCSECRAVRKNMSDKTCTVDGCGRMHRARGLCGSHYNQEYRPRRHRKVERPCTYCGELVLKYQSKKRKPFCSFICRDLWLIENPPVRRKPVQKKQPPRPKPVKDFYELQVSVCAICSVRFAHRPGSRRYCGNTCRKRARDLRRGERHAIRREAIFERDDFICWLCGDPCDRLAMVPEDSAPTVDHITPRSKGGSDDPENLACAHFICNSTRGASWDFPTIRRRKAA